MRSGETSRGKIAFRSDVNVRPPHEPSSLDDIVEVHIAAFPGFFMTQLGQRFLRGYYQCVLDYPDGLLLTEFEEQGCIGFVSGFVEPSSFYLELRRRRIRLGLAAVSGIVTRPRSLITLMVNYRRAGKVSREEPEPGTAELSSLAVRPDIAGRGVGSRLVRRFIAAAANRGASRVILTTDANNNDSVNRFYKGLGFTSNRTFEARRGRMLNEYVLTIGKDWPCDKLS